MVQIKYSVLIEDAFNLIGKQNVMLFSQPKRDRSAFKLHKHTNT